MKAPVQIGDLVRYNPIKNHNRQRPLVHIEPNKVYKVVDTYLTKTKQFRMRISYKGELIPNTYNPDKFDILSVSKKQEQVQDPKRELYTLPNGGLWEIIHETTIQVVIKDQQTGTLRTMDKNTFYKHATKQKDTPRVIREIGEYITKISNAFYIDERIAIGKEFSKFIQEYFERGDRNE